MAALPDDLDIEQSKPLLEEGQVESQAATQSRETTASLCRKIAVVSYGLSIVMLIASLVYPTDWQCTQRLSTWCEYFMLNVGDQRPVRSLAYHTVAPMLEAVESEWRPLTSDVVDAKYRGKPSATLEKAWFDLWAYGSLGIQPDLLPRLNKSIDSKEWSIVPMELGGGVRAYFEGFHQLHCVDLIRQYTYRDQYDYSDLPAWDQSEAMRLNHVEHCIEILRIVLMCQADVTPYLLSVDEEGEIKAHVNSRQRCRKWDRLAKWADDHIVEPYNMTEEKMKHMADHHGDHDERK